MCVNMKVNHYKSSSGRSDVRQLCDEDTLPRIQATQWYHHDKNVVTLLVKQMNRKSWRSANPHTKILLILVWIFSWTIFYCVCVGAEEIENLARGGDFETPDDMAQWGLWKAAATQGSMKIDKKNAAVGESSLYVFDIILDPLDKWKPNIVQVDVFILEKKKLHTYSAFLKAEKPRKLRMTFIDHINEPWPMGPDKIFDVGTEWKEYWVTSIPAALSGSLQISNAPDGSRVNYWIDGVRFYRGQFQPTIPPRAVSITDKLTTTWGTIKTRYGQ